MRLHIHKNEFQPEHINLILMVTLLLALGAAIIYFGTSFSAPSQTAGFGGLVSNW
jgi:hypothetical protein